MRHLLFLAGILSSLCWAPGQAVSQQTSEIDTFRVVNVTASPGDTVPVQFYLVNDSCELAAISAYIRIDNSILEWVGEWDSIGSPLFYVKHDTLFRARIPGLFEPYAPLVLATNFWGANDEFGVMVGAGANASIGQGRGSIVQFYLRVKEGVPVGTQTQIRPFNPVDESPGHTDPRRSSYADLSGLLNVYPTLVGGELTVVESVLCGDANGDALVNISDVVYLIAYIFAGGAAPSPPWTGDVNCDSMVNISDALYLLFSAWGGPPPCDPSWDGSPDCGPNQ